MRVREARVYVFNNDEFVDDYGALPDGRRVRYEGFPHVAVHLIPDRELLSARESLHVTVRLMRGDEELARLRGEAQREGWMFVASEMHLPSKIPADTAEVLVEETGDRLVVKLPEQVRVFGRVTDFEGRPLERAYVVLCMRGGFAIARTDSRGVYELRAPAGLYHHVFVCDGRYGRETLEFYGWRLRLRGSEFRLDARVGQIELYRMCAAETPERTVVVEFVPMDIAHTVRALEMLARGLIRREDIGRDEFYPEIDVGDVEVYLNDVRLDVWSVCKRRHLLRDYGIEASRPCYVVEAKVPEHLPPGVYTLRVVIRKRLRDGRVECGEAVIFDFELWT